MTLYEGIKLNQGAIKMLFDAGLHSNDWEYIQLYEEYMSLHSEGHKMTWIVDSLANKYGICERKVYQLISRFQKPLHNLCSAI